MIYTVSTELSAREVGLIGSIVSQWGFLETDIFIDTLLSFGEEESLPPSMNNAQFSAVLRLWLDRVVERQDEARKAVLKAQYDEILLLSEYRQAVVHSRWEWSPDAPDVITAVRVHKKNILYVKFTTDDLAEVSARLGQVRYWVRYPGGVADREAEMSEGGGYISRRGYDLLTGRAALDEPGRPDGSE